MEGDTEMDTDGNLGHEAEEDIEQEQEQVQVQEQEQEQEDVKSWEFCRWLARIFHQSSTKREKKGPVDLKEKGESLELESSEHGEKSKEREKGKEKGKEKE